MSACHEGSHIWSDWRLIQNPTFHQTIYDPNTAPSRADPGNEFGIVGVKMIGLPSSQKVQIRICINCDQGAEIFRWKEGGIMRCAGDMHIYHEGRTVCDCGAMHLTHPSREEFEKLRKAVEALREELQSFLKQEKPNGKD